MGIISDEQEIKQCLHADADVTLKGCPTVTHVTLELTIHCFTVSNPAASTNLDHASVTTNLEHVCTLTQLPVCTLTDIVTSNGHENA